MNLEKFFPKYILKESKPMKRRTMRKIKSVLVRMTAFTLTVLTVFLSAPLVFANETYQPATGITSGAVYMLKNYYSGKYLTLPGYFDYTVTDTNPVSKNNIYQSAPKVNDEYSRAVRVTYSQTDGKYTITPLILENFGGGYVAYEGMGNVAVSSILNDNSKWIIEYVESKGAYVIKTANGRAISAYGTDTGSLNVTSTMAHEIGRAHV